MIRQQLRFYGNVQGVGFRYSAKYSAEFLGLTGWVFNDFDGTVLMEVQGKKEKIDQLLNMLENRPFIVVDKIERNEIPVVKEWEFEIKD